MTSKTDESRKIYTDIVVDPLLLIRWCGDRTWHVPTTEQPIVQYDEYTIRATKAGGAEVWWCPGRILDCMNPYQITVLREVRTSGTTKPHV